MESTVSTLFRKASIDLGSLGSHKNFHPDNNSWRGGQTFLRGFRPVVLLGRIFCLLSRTDVTSEQEQKRKINVAFLLSACFSTFFLANAILLLNLNLEVFQRDKATLIKVEGFHHAVYACSMSFVYLYQCFATPKYRRIVQKFAGDDSPQNSNVSYCFVSFPKFCILVVIVCLSMGILENSLFDWQNLQCDDSGGSKASCSNASVLEIYYKQYFIHWHIILPHYNSFLTFIMVVLIKLGTWGWVHADNICITLCRALWEKLRLLMDSLMREEDQQKLYSDQLQLQKAGKQRKFSVFGTAFENYQDRYVKITELIEQVEDYICPLVMACYAGNIYIIIVFLFNWIGPLANEVIFSQEKFVHLCFAFFQYSFRVAAITYYAAELNQISSVIQKKIQSCPNVAYSISVERLERNLMGNPTGISLWGSFVISRKYFISIISFIFTAEIVLLQTFSSFQTAQKMTQVQTQT